MRPRTAALTTVAPAAPARYIRDRLPACEFLSKSLLLIPVRLPPVAVGDSGWYKKRSVAYNDASLCMHSLCNLLFTQSLLRKPTPLALTLALTLAAPPWHTSRRCCPHSQRHQQGTGQVKNILGSLLFTHFLK